MESNYGADVDLSVIWDTIEKTVVMIDQGQGEFDNHMNTLQGAILMLLDHPPEAVVKQVAASWLPVRPTVSWLLHEAQRIRQADRVKILALAACWQNDWAPEHGPLMEMPKA